MQIRMIMLVFSLFIVLAFVSCKKGDDGQSGTTTPVNDPPVITPVPDTFYAGRTAFYNANIGQTFYFPDTFKVAKQRDSVFITCPANSWHNDYYYFPNYKGPYYNGDVYGPYVFIGDSLKARYGRVTSGGGGHMETFAGTRL